MWKYNGVMGLLIGTTYLGVCTFTSVMRLHTKHAMTEIISNFLPPIPPVPLSET